MGANAQTSVPTFTAGEVLTAANMNISARTGVPVFADTTARDAAFGGTGEKVLAEGQMAFVENLTGDAQIQYYDGASWVSLGSSGLTLITAQTIGSAVSSVAVSSCFSSTYDNYYVNISGGVGSAAQAELTLQLGSTTTNYYFSMPYLGFGVGAGVTAANSSGAASNFNFAGNSTTNTLNANFYLLGPNLAKNTMFSAFYVRATTGGIAGMNNGFLNDSTQYTGFTIAVSTGTITGGTIRVYGLRN